MTELASLGRNPLDRALDDVGQVTPALADELFAVVDALDSSATLRRALTDPGAEPERRVGLVQSLFGARTSAQTTQVVTEAARLRWGGGRAFADALERQAVRAELISVGQQSSNRGSDEVEDELFRLSRLVDANPELRNALADRSRDLSARQQLITQLLGDRTSAATVKLARRAVSARERTFTATLEVYVNLAAQLRNRAVATVRVARPLDDDQLQRLRTALTRQVGREVSIQQVIDPEVLGGVRIELGDEVIEGTVASRLSSVRRQFGGS